MRIILLYAFLALGLLLDGAGLFRMTLFCAAVHETGHILVYLLCAHRLPTLCVGAGGVSLGRTAQLTRTRELAVTAAGPMANFLLCGALYFHAQRQATYGAYFLAAVSLCVGCYNLLPFGVLDGARLLQLLCSARHLPTLLRVQDAFLLLFCCCVPCLAFAPGLSIPLRAAALLAPLYLFLQRAFS